MLNAMFGFYGNGREGVKKIQRKSKKYNTRKKEHVEETDKRNTTSQL